jgi:hypothetical protein
MDLPALEPTSRTVVDRVVYATITIMSVLVIYDGWQHLELLDVVGVILGPVLAMFLAHIFSATLAYRVARGRAITGRERWQIVRTESRFLLLAAPPIVIVIALDLAGVSLGQCIRVVVLVGTASLGFWGGFAGRRAGLTGWRLGMMVVAGLIIGGTVLVLQIILQPGTPVTDAFR